MSSGDGSNMCTKVERDEGQGKDGQNLESNISVQPTVPKDPATDSESPADFADSYEKERIKRLDAGIQQMWSEINEEMKHLDEEEIDFLALPVPIKLSRRVFAEEVSFNPTFKKSTQCDLSAAIALSKACELLVVEMAERSLLSRKNPWDKSPLKAEDVLRAIEESENYDLFAEHLEK